MCMELLIIILVSRENRKAVTAAEALKTIDSLGHLATGYHNAEERLEKKF